MPRWFIQSMLAMIYGEALMAIADNTWHLRTLGLLLWLVLSLLLFIPLRRLYP